MQKLQGSGPFDKFAAAGRTGDLDFSLSSRNTDLLSAMRTADKLFFCVHIHPLFFAAFPDIFGKHAVIHPDQQNPADIVQCRCPQQAGKQDAYQCSHQEKPWKMVDPISALHKFFEFLSHTNTIPFLLTLPFCLPYLLFLLHLSNPPEAIFRKRDGSYVIFVSWLILILRPQKINKLAIK